MPTQLKQSPLLLPFGHPQSWFSRKCVRGYHSRKISNKCCGNNKRIFLVDTIFSVGDFAGSILNSPRIGARERRWRSTQTDAIFLERQATFAAPWQPPETSVGYRTMKTSTLLITCVTTLLDRFVMLDGWILFHKSTTNTHCTEQSIQFTLSLPSSSSPPS